jgi:hypothetical protein
MIIGQFLDPVLDLRGPEPCGDSLERIMHAIVLTIDRISGKLDLQAAECYADVAASIIRLTGPVQGVVR